MAITAADVNKLRQQTGAGMMDCKNALVEANGDFEAAVDILRKKGQKIAAKRGENEAREGLIIAEATPDAKAGVIVTLNCETDFVAKNDGYRALVQSIVDIALKNMPSSVEELKSLKYDEKLSVDEKITEQIGVIGEKLDLSAFAGGKPIYLKCNKIPSDTLINKINDIISLKNGGSYVFIEVTEKNKTLKFKFNKTTSISIKEDLENAMKEMQ